MLYEGRVVMECRRCGGLGGPSFHEAAAAGQKPSAPASGAATAASADAASATSADRAAGGGPSGGSRPAGGCGDDDGRETGICVGGNRRIFTRCWHCTWELSKCAEMLKGNSEAAIDGVLYKKGKHLHQWQARYYVLVDNMLYYYRRKGDAKPRGFMFLEGCYVELLSEQLGGRQYGFAIVHPKGETVSKRLLFANSAKEQKEWVDALRVATKQQALEQLYQVGEQLGHGKFSIVYKGIHRETNELYAIKVIDKGKINGHERELLRSEMAILRLLNHPNVIYMKELLDTKETLYIVMELVRGGELFDLIQQNHRLPELHVNRIISQLLSTVYYLHKCGIVHRDLKPENILLTDRTPNATIKLTDFGLSTLCAPNEVLHQPCGTLAYVAPEVLTMEGYNHQVDVWSIGVIMYLLLRGRLPFPISKTIGHPSFFENTPVSFDGPVWREISSSAKDLVLRMLQPDPRRRITVAEALQHIWVKNPTAVVNDGSKSIEVYISHLDEVRHPRRYVDEPPLAACSDAPTFTIPKNAAVKTLQAPLPPPASSGSPPALRPPVPQSPASALPSVPPPQALPVTQSARHVSAPAPPSAHPFLLVPVSDPMPMAPVGLSTAVPGATLPGAAAGIAGAPVSATAAPAAAPPLARAEAEDAAMAMNVGMAAAAAAVSAPPRSVHAGKTEMTASKSGDSAASLVAWRGAEEEPRGREERGLPQGPSSTEEARVSGYSPGSASRAPRAIVPEEESGMGGLASGKTSAALANACSPGSAAARSSSLAPASSRAPPSAAAAGVAMSPPPCSAYGTPGTALDGVKTATRQDEAFLTPAEMPQTSPAGGPNASPLPRPVEPLSGAGIEEHQRPLS
ncbi:calcium dependent protein kinase CDPK7 [Besnoitia besnoiti]|uniref:non-specific serine/threonine protein kinase n=1 Tax=Besnoitia besnoiti TaxID=94643 RepID=A0A2A9MCJ4_BESBE|nr:calcium dependent protein kinase CDPK7 [Besnoitia besnoiti]PFH34944.1 calcium dependent protein kinase CDPK7 [Besnoitia besnoiti]